MWATGTTSTQYAVRFKGTASRSTVLAAWCHPSQLDRDRSVHLVEILEAAKTSANTGAPVDLNTGFEVV